MKEKMFIVADQLWSRIFHLIPGTTSRTAALIAVHHPEKGREVLRKMLRTRNPKGLATHARSILAYHDWHLSRWPKLPWLPVDNKQSTKDLYCAVLVDFLEDIMDADVSPGVPRSRLSSLKLAVKLCRPDNPWPLEETVVTTLTQT